MIMDVFACGIKDLSTWCKLYADDIVLCSTRGEEVEKNRRVEKGYGKDRGLKISRQKTVYLRFNTNINLQGENLERVNTFKYPGATLTENGDLDVEMTMYRTAKRRTAY